MDRILGQDRAVDVLQTALSSGRMHHAWVFAGPPGVGKFTTAIELAKLLLDPQAGPELSGRLSTEPDSRIGALIDESVREMLRVKGELDEARVAGHSQKTDRLPHPDLHLIFRELALYSDDRELRTRTLINIPIQLLRERMIGGAHEGPAYRTATLGHGKVFIIDEAERMAHGQNETQNALLKTLEEPPPETYIFLITARPDRLLPTIHSRCQRVNFSALNEQAMARWFDLAGPSVDADERAWIERFADGSPGQAVRAARYGFFRWARTLAPMLARLRQGEYPPDLGSTLAELVEDYAKTWVQQHKQASKDQANKDGTQALFQILSADARQHLCASADDLGAAQLWARFIDLLREAEAQIERNVNQKLALENLVVQWRSMLQSSPTPA